VIRSAITSVASFLSVADGFLTGGPYVITPGSSRAFSDPPAVVFAVELNRKIHAPSIVRTIRLGRRGYLPVWTTRQTDFDPSSVTINDPSDAVATPTGRPQTAASGSTKPVRKSS